MSVILGIDPGLTGAIACLAGPPVPCALWDLPTLHDQDIGKRIDVVKLAALLTKALPPGEPLQVVIEAMAHGGMKKGRTNAATVDSQTWTQAAIVSTFELLGVRIAGYVSPSTWKKFYGIAGKDKDAPATQREVREVAVGLYPALAEFLQLQKNHNRAEALLIAHWWRKVRA